MCEQNSIDPARAALISHRIGQTFSFMRDVIDDPRLLTLVPDGSTLFFRDIEIPGHQLRLVAYKAPGSAEKWAARLTGSTRSDADEAGHAIVIPASVESDESAEAALDAFEELIHTIVAMTQEPTRQSA